MEILQMRKQPMCFLRPSIYHIWSFALQTRAKQSAPKPLPVGSTKGNVTAIAMAASIAFPPDFRISRPTWDATGLTEQAMPLRAKITLR